MDERETEQQEEAVQIQQEYKQQIPVPQKRNKKRILLAVIFLLLLTAAGASAIFLFFNSISKKKGYKDYTVQKEQYYVEYSEEYDYWDVLTVEYPQISGIDEEVQTPLNQLL